jgi:hypothetical protein
MSELQKLHLPPFIHNPFLKLKAGAR